MKQKTVFQLGLEGLKKYFTAFFLSLLLILFTIFFIGQLWVQVAIQLCSIVMVVSVLYHVFWQQGEHDANYVNRELIARDAWKGVKAGFIVAVPMLLSWVALLICKFVCSSGIFHYVHIMFQFFNAPFREFFVWLAPTSVTAEGIVVPAFGETGIVILLCYGAFFLLIPLVSGVSYYLGLRRVNLAERIVYKKQK